MPKVICNVERCKNNQDGECKAEEIYLSDDHFCTGGCDDGWEMEKETKDG